MGNGLMRKGLVLALLLAVAASVASPEVEVQQISHEENTAQPANLLLEDLATVEAKYMVKNGLNCADTAQNNLQRKFQALVKAKLISRKDAHKKFEAFNDKCSGKPAEKEERQLGSQLAAASAVTDMATVDKVYMKVSIANCGDDGQDQLQAALMALVHSKTVTMLAAKAKAKAFDAACDQAHKQLELYGTVKKADSVKIVAEASDKVLAKFFAGITVNADSCRRGRMDMMQEKLQAMVSAKKVILRDAKDETETFLKACETAANTANIQGKGKVELMEAMDTEAKASTKEGAMAYLQGAFVVQFAKCADSVVDGVQAKLMAFVAAGKLDEGLAMRKSEEFAKDCDKLFAAQGAQGKGLGEGATNDANDEESMAANKVMVSGHLCNEEGENQMKAEMQNLVSTEKLTRTQADAKEEAFGVACSHKTDQAVKRASSVVAAKELGDSSGDGTDPKAMDASMRDAFVEEIEGAEPGVVQDLHPNQGMAGMFALFGKGAPPKIKRVKPVYTHKKAVSAFDSLLGEEEQAEEHDPLEKVVDRRAAKEDVKRDWSMNRLQHARKKAPTEWGGDDAAADNSLGIPDP